MVQAKPLMSPYPGTDAPVVPGAGMLPELPSVLGGEPLQLDGFAADSPEGAARLRGVVREQFDFVWRYVRRLGVPDTEADDAAQQVFWVFARRLADVVPGCERAFLCSTAVRVASDVRRARSRRREVSSGTNEIETADTSPGPEELSDRLRSRALLDEVLSAMPLDLRAVFVLYELEELSVVQIAAMLEVPTGTAASRLRRAREAFQSIVQRMKARGTIPGAIR